MIVGGLGAPLAQHATALTRAFAGSGDDVADLRAAAGATVALAPLVTVPAVALAPDEDGDGGDLPDDEFLRTGAVAAAPPTAESPPTLLPSAPAPVLVSLLALPGRVALRLAGGALEGVRFLVLAVVLAALAYRWFEGSWTGTGADMAAVFTWAFSFDLGVEAVRQVATAGPGTVLAAPTTATQGTPGGTP